MSRSKANQEEFLLNQATEEPTKTFDITDKENLHIGNLLEVGHSLQMVDEDVTVFTNKLDSLITSFRTESLKEFIKMKRNILVEQAQRIDTARKNCDALLSSKQDELERVKDELTITSTQSKRSTLQIERLCSHFKKFNKRAVVQYHKAFIGWKEIVNKKKRYRQIINIGLWQYNKVLKATAVSGWKRLYEADKKKKYKAETEKKLKVLLFSQPLDGDREVDTAIWERNRGVECKTKGSK